MFSNFTVDQLSINETTRRYPYVNKTYAVDKTHDFKQKLLAAVHFITTYWDPQTHPELTVVIHGSGPHLEFLVQMFPNIKFVSHDNLTDKIAKSYKNTNVFFINEKFSESYDDIVNNIKKERFIDDNSSDINIIAAQDDALTQFNNQKIETLTNQIKWLKALNPIEALLQFDIVDRGNNFKYLVGELYWPIWRSRNETRVFLVPSKGVGRAKGYSEGMWNVNEFLEWNGYFESYTKDQKMFYNLFTGEEDPISPPQLRNDFDSLAETLIGIRYMMKNGADINMSVVLSKAMSWELRPVGQSVLDLSDPFAKVRSSPKKAFNPKLILG